MHNAERKEYFFLSALCTPGWSVYICAILVSKRLVNRISGKNLFLYMYNTKNFGNYCISPCCFVNILLYFM